MIRPTEDSSEARGVRLFFDYDQKDLTDETPIGVVGYAKNGENYVEFHVPDGNLTVLE